MPRQKPVVVLPPEVAGARPLTIQGYQDAARRTDKIDRNDLRTPILGLFGEIGSLLATLKKKTREGEAYATYDYTIVEELGDVLWYLNAVASHAGLAMIDVAAHVPQDELHAWDERRPDVALTFSTLQEHAKKSELPEIETLAAELAGVAGGLVEAYRTGKLAGNRDAISGWLLAVLRALIGTARAAGVDLERAALENLHKTFSRWPLDPQNPPYNRSIQRREPRSALISSRSGARHRGLFCRLLRAHGERAAHEDASSSRVSWARRAL